jgi:methylmalonyl-CoA mutase
LEGRARDARRGRSREEHVMNDTSRPPLVYKPQNKVRFVTAAALFDGHDASINIMRRILQSQGCEVIHLGHNRSVDEIVNCAIQEDAHAIAISSYQGGHVEFFKYMLDLLRERGAGHVKVYGGGGGVIVPAEMKELHDYGVARLFSPEDGQRLGLVGMISEIVSASDVDLAAEVPADSVGARRRDACRADASPRADDHRPRSGHRAGEGARGAACARRED